MSNVRTILAREFTWTKSGEIIPIYLGTAFVSDLIIPTAGPVSGKLPQVLSVIGKSETKSFTYCKIDYDREGVVNYWEYSHDSSTGVFKLRIYND